MDTTGKVLLSLGIVFLVGSIAVYYVLSKIGPRGSVLAAGGILFVAGLALGSSNPPYREVLAFSGVLRLVGFIGLILGLLDAARSRRKGRPGSGERLGPGHPPGARPAPLPLESCPHCEMCVVRNPDGTCPECSKKIVT